jgi:queuine/archaeosine tRNA-ribosyltransferase
MLSVFDFVNRRGIFLGEGKECVRKGVSAIDSLALPSDIVLYLDSGGFELSKFAMSTWYDALDVYTVQGILGGDVWTILDYPVRKGKEKTVARAIETNLAFAKDVARIHHGHAKLMAVAHGVNIAQLVNASRTLSAIDVISVIALSEAEFHSKPPAHALFGTINDIVTSQRKPKSLHVLGASSPRVWLKYLDWGVRTFDSTAWLSKCLNPFAMRWAPSSKGWGRKCGCPACVEHSRPLEKPTASYSDVVRHNLSVITRFVTPHRALERRSVS